MSNEIQILGRTYTIETSVDNKTMILTDTKTGEWIKVSDDQNQIGDPDFYDDWEEFIRIHYDDIELNER